LVGGATLTNVVDNDESGETCAYSLIVNVLIEAAGVDTITLVGSSVVGVASGADSADAVDGVRALYALAEKGCLVEYLIFGTPIAMLVEAVADFD
jgi:hypothetical protein